MELKTLLSLLSLFYNGPFVFPEAVKQMYLKTVAFELTLQINNDVYNYYLLAIAINISKYFFMLTLVNEELLTLVNEELLNQYIL